MMRMLFEAGADLHIRTPTHDAATTAAGVGWALPPNAAADMTTQSAQPGWTRKKRSRSRRSRQALHDTMSTSRTPGETALFGAVPKGFRQSFNCSSIAAHRSMQNRGPDALSLTCVRLVNTAATRRARRHCACCASSGPRRNQGN